MSAQNIPSLADLVGFNLPATKVVGVTKCRLGVESCPGVTPKNNRHKKSPTFSRKALIYLAPPDGLEPPT